jgi:hypothetical protein
LGAISEASEKDSVGAVVVVSMPPLEPPPPPTDRPAAAPGRGLDHRPADRALFRLVLRPAPVPVPVQAVVRLRLLPPQQHPPDAATALRLRPTQPHGPAAGCR